jgi:putative 4-mercaptohistidine N1-methyltranferase
MAGNYYDTDRGISEYLLFHYGGYEHRLPAALTDGLDFPVRCVRECLDTARVPKSSRALDLGCAVGRSSFELARVCSEVIGIDYSERFVSVANHLRDNGSFGFQYIVQGEITRAHRAVVPMEIDRTRVKFERGDAVHLRSDLGIFDVVLMANLIDRVNDPAKCLAQLPGLLKPGGQLIITSPYTWLPEYTPRENWLGGFIYDDEPVDTFAALERILSPNFELKHRKDLPFIIREHTRKFQMGFAEASAWVRK